ncbi:MAG: hypothetical protein QW812_04550 [Thermoplasmataceae archaeon]
MGFSYVVAVAVMLSSSLIFFGIIYSDYVHTNQELYSAQQSSNQLVYEYSHSDVNVSSISAVAVSGGFNISLTFQNTGSITLDLNKTSLLVNGTLTNFTYRSQYLFPLGNDSISFIAPSPQVAVEVVFNTGYEKYVEVNA